MDKQRLIRNISPIIHLFADERNFILIFRNNEKQNMRNGYHTYFQQLEDVFKEIFDHEVKRRLANGKDKSTEEMVHIIKEAREWISQMIIPFEDYELKPNTPAQLSIG